MTDPFTWILIIAAGDILGMSTIYVIQALIHKLRPNVPDLNKPLRSGR